MSADTAHTLAGKLMFLCSTMFGQLGKAAMKPIYGRAHGLQTQGSSDTLNSALKQGLTTLVNILESIRPQIIPFNIPGPVTCLYTDAYFLLGDLHMSPGDDIPTKWSISQVPRLENGWGFVCRLPNKTVYGYGRVPGLLAEEVLQPTSLYLLLGVGGTTLRNDLAPF